VRFGIRVIFLVRSRNALGVVLFCAIGLLVCIILSEPHYPRGRCLSCIVISIVYVPIML
jgi:hypothetical protein